MDISFAISAIIATILFSAFFSGMEIAFISANRLQIELENKQGQFSASILSYLLKHPKQLIGTLLVGNNIALVIYGIFMGEIILHVLGIDSTLQPTLSLILQTIISTLIILLTGEFLPKAIFSAAPNRLLSLFTLPLIALYFILYIPASIVTGLSRLTLRIFFKADLNPNKVEFGRVDLDHYIREATKNVNPKEEIDHEIQIFQNALDFGSLKARDCLIPRNEIIALDIEYSVEELKAKFIETGLSKILIFRRNIDNIIGYVHSFELFLKPANIKNVLRPVIIVPEPMAANEVLEQFILQKRNMAVVVDEYGGTSGILTMEDIVEQIFGDIEDEHDVEEMIERDLGDGQFEFSARLSIDYLNETYRLSLPEKDDYDTLAGLFLHHYEDIPEIGTLIRVGDYTLEVTKVSQNRIEIIHLRDED